MGLTATCDECGTDAEGVVKGVPEGWTCSITGELLCPKCDRRKFLPHEGHPETDEPFTEVVHLTTETPVDAYHAMPPAPPCRMEEEYDEDGEVTRSRELSEIEYEQSCRAYEAALEDFHERGGVFHVPGKTLVTGRFRCPSGAWAEGAQDGTGYWVWAKWAAPPEGYRLCPRCEGANPAVDGCSYCRGKGVLKLEKR